MTGEIECAPIGEWRLTRADPWDRHSPDPVEADRDDDSSPEIKIFFHLGDDATLKKARRW